jgi:hypothetical protein
VIPEPHEYLSFLMGADAISDDELARLGIDVLEGAGSPFRGLLIPERSLAAYRELVRQKITPGFWNDIVGRHHVLFIFKLADGTLRELELSEGTRSEIAQLCSSLNQDPIEKTSDMPRYLSGNPLYREVMDAFHAGRSAQ